MNTTVYLPDDLAADVKAKLGDTNISAICQAALRAELARADARATLDADGYDRVVVYDSKKSRDVAFRGNHAGQTSHGVSVWITPKRAIAVYSHDGEELDVYDDFDALQGTWGDDELLAMAAEALGEEYTEELGI